MLFYLGQLHNPSHFDKEIIYTLDEGIKGVCEHPTILIDPDIYKKIVAEECGHDRGQERTGR